MTELYRATTVLYLCSSVSSVSVCANSGISDANSLALSLKRYSIPLSIVSRRSQQRTNAVERQELMPCFIHLYHLNLLSTAASPN